MSRIRWKCDFSQEMEKYIFSLVVGKKKNLNYTINKELHDDNSPEDRPSKSPSEPAGLSEV